MEWSEFILVLALTDNNVRKSDTLKDEMFFWLIQCWSRPRAAESSVAWRGPSTD